MFLGFLLELAVSLAICGAVAYYLFLSAPVDELGGGAAGEAALGGHDGLSPSALPLAQPHADTWWAPLVPWYADSPLHPAYEYLLLRILRVDDPMAAASFDAASRGGARATTAAAADAAVGGGRDVHSRSARRGRRPRGGPGAACVPLSGANRPLPSQQTSPLRQESTHWLSVLVRWLGILVLGGGTTSHEVWSDRVRCGVQRALFTANTGWEQKVREREAAMAASARTRRSNAPQPPRAQAGRMPLLKLTRLELGPGLARDPPHTGRDGGTDGSGGVAGSTAASAGGAGNSSGGPGSGGGGAGMTSGNSISDAASSLAASLKHSAGVNLAQWVAAAEAVAVGGTGGGSSGGGGNGPNGGGGSEALSASLQGREGDDGGGAGQPPQQQQQQQSATTGSAPTLGIVLPRVAGSITSVEIPFFTPSATASQSATAAAGSDEADRSADGTVGGPGSRRDPHDGPQRGPSSSVTAPAPMERAPPVTALTSVPTPLRCFCVPIVYEDNRFVLRLSCCLPLGAFLPAALAVPADVLSVECDVSIRRVRFAGDLHAAFHGPAVELSFPTPPQFTVLCDVARPASRGGRMASSATTASAFIATSTMRNVVSVGGARAPVVATTAAFGLSPRSANHTPSLAPRGIMHAPPPLPLPGQGGPASQQQQQQQQLSQGPPNLSPAEERNDKIQEMALLAVRRAIDSITYPRVLEGRINMGGEGGRLLAWSRKTASLPLYT